MIDTLVCVYPEGVATIVDGSKMAWSMRLEEMRLLNEATSEIGSRYAN